MALTEVLLLLAAGLTTGFVASLVGIGGGVIFAPVLFFYFQSRGIAPDIVAQLTIGSSLFCTLVVALASAYFQDRRGAVRRPVALQVGLLSGVAVFLMTRFVTTQPWYDGQVFRVVFGVMLVVVAVRMLLKKAVAPPAEGGPEPKLGWARLAGVGSTAGVVSAAAGVGGGVILVPAYSGLLRLPMPVAVGTSSATIVLISLMGVINYAWMGLGADVPAYAVGYVDVGHAAALALPSILTARLGVRVAHRIQTHVLRWSFAAVALIAAARLIWKAIAG